MPWIRGTHDAATPPISASRRGCRRASGRLAPRTRASLSDPPDHADRAVPARRLDRRRRPHRRRPHVAHARPADRGAERLRRRRHHRLDPGDARRSRRLHHPDGPDGHARRLGRALSEPRLQARRGFRADRHGHRLSADHRGEEGLPGEGPQGIRRLRESEFHARSTRRMPASARSSSPPACCSIRSSAPSRRWCRSTAARRP